jgi:hypothetical protein
MKSWGLKFINILVVGGEVLATASKGGVALLMTKVGPRRTTDDRENF